MSVVKLKFLLFHPPTARRRGGAAGRIEKTPPPKIHKSLGTPRGAHVLRGGLFLIGVMGTRDKDRILLVKPYENNGSGDDSGKLKFAEHLIFHGKTYTKFKIEKWGSGDGRGTRGRICL